MTAPAAGADDTSVETIEVVDEELAGVVGLAGVVALELEVKLELETVAVLAVIVAVEVVVKLWLA